LERRHPAGPSLARPHLHGDRHRQFRRHGGQPPAWIVYSPLPPLFLLMFSGIYMFALPYAASWRQGLRAEG
jgi:hypothetical protein